MNFQELSLLAPTSPHARFAFNKYQQAQHGNFSLIINKSQDLSNCLVYKNPDNLINRLNNFNCPLQLFTQIW